MNEMQDKVEALEIVVSNLPAKDKVFADSLIAQYKKNGSLSDKQMYWVKVLAERAMGKEPKPEVANVGSFQGMIDIFNKAKAKLKYPKIFLEVDATPVVLSLAGSTSKMPGTVNVAGEGDFYNRKWYGRVMADGTWVKAMKQPEDTPKVEVLLKAISRNPAKAAKEFGTLTGRCCFCNAPLSDEHSTAAGFGPTCAKNWGLHDEWKAAQSVLKVAA